MMKRNVWLVSLAIIVVVVGGGIYFFNSNSDSVINLDKEYEINGNVVLSGTFTGESFVDHAEEFSEINEAGKLEGKKTYFVFVDSFGEVKLAEFEEVSLGELTIALGESNQFYGLRDSQYREQNLGKSENVEVIINGETYEFELKPEENVYFVIQEG